MKIIGASLLGRVNRKSIEREVESQLRFHLEMLTDENLRQGMTYEEAERAALKSFGNVERIKNQCVEIGKRSHPLMHVLKSFLVAVFLAGVLARVSSPDIYGKQIGSMLMTIAALSGLLVYVRGLRFLIFVPKEENASSLGLGGIEAMPFSADNTPLERAIADD